MTFVFIIIFILSLSIVIGILYMQYKRVQKGEIEIQIPHRDDIELEPPITLRDILILVLYILKHVIQFIIVQISKLYFIISKKIQSFLKKHRTHKLSKIVKKIKKPTIPPQVKSFIKKTVNETKEKIIRVKQDLIELEETIDKRVD